MGLSMAEKPPVSNENNGTDAVGPLDIKRIMGMIPHRYPMLMIDRFLSWVPGEKAVALKNVSINEQFFAGHFPTLPVMPGVLIVESMAQTAAMLVVQTLGDAAEGKLVYFMTIDEARFRKPVVPGDSMYVHVTKIAHRRNVWKFQGEAKVDGVLCAEAVFSAMIID